MRDACELDGDWVDRGHVADILCSNILQISFLVFLLCADNFNAY